MVTELKSTNRFSKTRWSVGKTNCHGFSHWLLSLNDRFWSVRRGRVDRFEEVLVHDRNWQHPSYICSTLSCIYIYICICSADSSLRCTLRRKDTTLPTSFLPDISTILYTVVIIFANLTIKPKNVNRAKWTSTELPVAQQIFLIVSHPYAINCHSCMITLTTRWKMLYTLKWAY